MSASSEINTAETNFCSFFALSNLRRFGLRKYLNRTRSNFILDLRTLSYLFRPRAQILAVLGGSCRIRRKPRHLARSSSRLALAVSQPPATFARCQPCLNLLAA